MSITKPDGLPPISVPVVTLNEEHNLRRCLASVRDWVDEIVVLDSGSTDGTRAVAEEFGARFEHQDWLGYRDQKSVALERCTRPWVLALDGDEEVSDELRESIFDFFRPGGAYETASGACFNRRTWFIDRWILHGDWYPDRKLRLFRRESGTWGGSPEHDFIELDGPCERLRGDLLHHSFPDMSGFVAKINSFSDVYLERMIADGSRWSWTSNLFRPWWRFFRGYILRRGFLDGFPGLWIAVGVAFQTFVRHSRLYEHQRSGKPPIGGECKSTDEAARAGS